MRKLLLLVLAAAAGASAQAPVPPPDIDPRSYSRLPMLTRPAQQDPDARRIWDFVAGKDRDTPPTGPGATSLYSLGVAEPMQMLNQYLRKSVVGPRYFELCAIIAAWEFQQAYEWSSHEPGARRAGVEQSVIDVVKYNRDVAGLAEKDAVVIRFGRDLFRKHRVSPELYARVVELFGRQGMFELTAIMGDYAMAAIMLNAVDQRLPPGREALLPPRE
jgi:4-carboxymuconolactone decarboxylase